MNKNESGAIETGPTDRSTDGPRGSGDAAAEQADGDAARGRAGSGLSPAEYRFSTHNKPRRAAAVTASDVDRVYAVLLDSLDGGRCYRSSADLDVDGLSGKQIGSALKQLAHAEDCPLAIERWTGANTTPAVWSVERNSAADGGLSEHVGRINGFGEGPDWCRCQECGATGDRPENINHRERCPGESGGVR